MERRVAAVIRNINTKLSVVIICLVVGGVWIHSRQRLTRREQVNLEANQVLLCLRGSIACPPILGDRMNALTREHGAITQVELVSTEWSLLHTMRVFHFRTKRGGKAFKEVMVLSDTAKLRSWISAQIF